MFHCDVVDIKNISLDKAQKFIESHKCGASLFFIGTVRDHNNEKEVTGITYDSHDVMVKKSFEEIYNEAIKKLDLQHPVAFVEHAKGYVPLGGISIMLHANIGSKSTIFRDLLLKKLKKERLSGRKSTTKVKMLSG